ncbi:MAG: LysE family transporter [Thermoplasmataceae archaeon]
MDLASAALVGIFLGISLAAPPGPVTAIIVNRASRSVFGAVTVGFGAMSADFVLMVLVIALGSGAELSPYDKYIYLSGSVVFFLMAMMIASSGSKMKETGERSSGYLSGLLVGIVNPFQIIWWFTAGLGFYEKFNIYPFIFLFVGTTAWVVFLSYLIRYSVIRFGEKIREITTGFSVITLVAFGIYFILLIL